MSTPFDGVALARLLVEQFGTRAAAEVVRQVRAARDAGNDAEAAKWLSILEAVLDDEAADETRQAQAEADETD